MGPPAWEVTARGKPGLFSASPSLDKPGKGNAQAEDVSGLLWAGMRVCGKLGLIPPVGEAREKLPNGDTHAGRLGDRGAARHPLSIAVSSWMPPPLVGSTTTHPVHGVLQP